MSESNNIKHNMNTDRSKKKISTDTSFSNDRITDFDTGIKNTVKSLTGNGGAENKTSNINPKESLNKKVEIKIPQTDSRSIEKESNWVPANPEDLKVRPIIVNKPVIIPTAFQQTSKHYDFVMAIDVHWTQVPPFIILPLPHPFIGIIYDIMDYIHFSIPIPKFIQNLSDSIPENIPLGGSIYVQGRHKATTTTSVIGVILPFKHITSIIPVYRIPISIEAPHEGEVYYGSKTVLGQGSEMSGCQPQHVLTCMGVPFGNTALPTMPNKPKKNPLPFTFYSNMSSMYTQISSGNPVLVGGQFVPHVYTLEEMAMRFAGMALMKGIAKGMGKGMSSGLKKFNNSILKNSSLSKYGLSKALSRKLCKYGFEPVNLVTGEMFFEWDDFDISGNTPLQWTNTWYSQRPYDNGLLGNGVFNNHDLFIELDYNSEIAAWMHPEENIAMPIPITEIGEDKIYFREQKIWIHRPNDITWVIYKEMDIYTYKRFKNNYGKYIYKVVHIRYNDGTQREYSYYPNLLLRTIEDIHSGYQINIIPNETQNRIAEVYAGFEEEKTLLVRYDYDDLGNLTHVWDKHNKAIIFQYDKNNYVIKRTNRNGMSYFWKYDNKGRVTHTYGINDIQEGILEYFDKEEYTKVTYPQLNNKTELYYYDENTLIYKKIDGEGGETWYDYTSSKELKMESSPEGRVTGYTYDEWGNISVLHTPDGEEYLYNYNQNNQLIARFSPSGSTEKWFYDELGRLIKHTDATGVITDYKYNDLERLPCENYIEEFNFYNYFEYNNRGQLIHLSNSENNNSFWKYDQYGKIIQFSSQDKTPSIWKRDSMGRVIGLHESGQLPLTIKYDAYDLPTYVSDGKQEWLMSYTPMGSLKKQIKRRAGSSENKEVLSFSYDAYENLINITNEKGEIYHFIRDANNQIIEEIGFDGLRKTYQRDLDGLIVNSILPNNKIIHYQYDLAGRLTQTLYPDGTYETFQYNNIGLLVKAENNTNTVLFQRNSLGLVTKETQDEYDINYQYNDFGKLINLQSSLGADFAYNYDTLGRLQNVLASQENITPWEVTIKNNKFSQEKQYTGGIESSFDYDHTGMPISQKVKIDKKTKLENDYYWSSGSRLMEVLDKISGRRTSFDYDIFGNLVAEHSNNGTSKFKNPDKSGCLFESIKQNDRVYDKGGKLLRDKKWFYNYDEQGNLILKSTRPINTAGIEKEKYPFGVSPISFSTLIKTGIGINNEDSLPNISGNIPTYIDVNEWQKGDWEYKWAINGMLSSVKRPDGEIVSFEYDALGRRTAKIYNKMITRFIWDGNVLLHEWQYNLEDRPQLIVDENENITKNKTEPLKNIITWVYEGNSYVPSAKLQNGKKATIISDYIGRPIQAYNEDGHLLWSSNYDIFGKTKNLRGEKYFVPFRQLGQYEDKELEGLYYNRFRYYDPESGNYISQDPIGLAGNNPTLYGYVSDSNTWVDPFGLDIKRIYEDAPYHGKIDNSVKSKAPINGQVALDNSVQIKNTSPRRIGVDAINNEIVVLDRTKVNSNGSELYHGHVRSWDNLHVDMQNKLKREGLVDKKGRIKGCKK